MLYIKSRKNKKFIIATEVGILHQINKQCPNKELYIAYSNLTCQNMKKTDLNKVKMALDAMEPQISISAEIREKAIVSLEMILAIK